MGAEPVQDWQRIAASALEWWRDAGVDMLVEDEARDWLVRAPAKSEPAPIAAAVATPVAEVLPDTLDAFVAWRLGDAAPEAGWMTPRLAPTGPADAEWVLVTDFPESDDGDVLMSGAAGRLLDRMLAAVGLSRDLVYLMPLATARPLTGHILPEDADRLLALAAHHLGLLKPRKLLLLGQSASRAIGATDSWPPRNSLRDVNQFGGNTLVAASYHPRWLLEKPAAKREAWKHLLLLSRGSTE